MKTYLFTTLLACWSCFAFAQKVRWTQTFPITNPGNTANNRSYIGMLDGPDFVLPALTHHKMNYGAYNLGDHRVYKLDLAGQRLDSLDIKGNLAIQDLCVWKNEVFLMAGFKDSLELGGQAYLNPGFGQAFIRVDQNWQASLLWTQSMDSTRVFTVNRKGNLVLAGDAGFGGSVHLSELSQNGQYLAGREIPELGYVFQISQNQEGNYLLTGGCMGPFFAMDTLTYVPPGTYHTYILALDSMYQAKWVNGIADVTCSNVRHVSKGGSQQYMTSLLSGAFQIGQDTSYGPSAGNLGDFYLVRVDEKGDFMWYRELPLDTGFHSVFPSEGLGLDMDDNGNVYWLGIHRGNDFAWSAQNHMTNYGGDDIWICSWDPAGQFRWAKSFGGSLYDQAHSLVVLGQDSLLISGRINGLAQFDSLQINGDQGASFLAMVLPPGPITAGANPAESFPVQLYPNPAQEALHLKYQGEQDVDFLIFDLRGKALLAGKVSSRQAIDISDLETGMYLMLIEGKQGRTLRKFQKMQ